MHRWSPSIFVLVILSISACRSGADGHAAADALAQERAAARSERPVGYQTSPVEKPQTEVSVQGDAPTSTERPEPRRVLPLPYTMRINSTNLDTMVASINAITAALPPDQAKGFQAAVRVIMVANLPLDKAKNANDITDQDLLAGSLKVLANKTAYEVILMGEAQVETFRRQVAKEDAADKAAVEMSKP